MQEVDIYAKATLKDSIVDMLLEDGYEDFFYFYCAKYAAHSLLQSAAEQVSGRQEYGLLRMFINKQDAQFIANKLYQAFGKVDVKIYMRDCSPYESR